jgi:hypothetical protein
MASAKSRLILKPVAGVDVEDGNDEEGDAGGDEDEVEHGGSRMALSRVLK